MHDSFTPIGGLVPLLNIQLGEVVFGGVGAGLYGMLVFVVLTGLSLALFFAVAGRSLTTFYVCCVAMGVATGYWAVFVTSAAEQFGTNLRATATTTAPNFVRGFVVPLTASFKALSGPAGTLGAAEIVGAVTLVVALVAWTALQETHGKDLAFVE